MPDQQKLYIVRKEYDGFGGAENVAKRYVDHFSSNFDAQLVYGGSQIGKYRFRGNKGPGWWKALSFSKSVNHFLRSSNKATAFSMTRGVAGHIFRVGDGVHRKWLLRKNSSFLKRILNPNHILMPRLEKFSIKNSKWIVPNSKMVADEISSEYPSTSNKIRVIHNGFANDRFCFANENSKLALRLEYGLFPEVLHVLFCANGWERKGLKHSIEMVAEINQILKCHLWVIGRGNKKHYEKLCNVSGISNEVHFMGSQQDVASWYQMVDLFVLPTLYDPFSNSCLEALACGCPVLTTSSNGASELIRSHNGLIVHSPKDVSSKTSVQWALKVKEFDRSKIHKSVSKFNSKNETEEYLKLLKADD